MKKTAILIFLMTLTMSVLAQLPTALPTVTCTSCTPNISTIVADGNGGAYIGGTFTSIGGVAANNIAHIKSDNTVDLTWNPSVTGTAPNVKAIVVYGQFVYIGGTFSMVNGTTFNNFAAIRVSDAQPINTLVLTNPVTKMLLSGSIMYIATNSSAGTIAGINTTIARVQIGTQTPTDPALAAFSGFVCKAGTVNDMYLTGSTLYIAGAFSQVISSSTTDNRANLAEVNATTGAATTFFNGKTLTLTSSTPINAIEVVNNILFVGGLFNNIAGSARNNFAGIDLSNGSVVTGTAYNAGTISPTSSTTNAYVYDMASNGTDLYVVGNFTTFLGSSVKSIAVLSNPTTTSPNTSAMFGTTGVSSINSQIKTISVASSTNIAIGGDFTSPQNYLSSLPYVAPPVTPVITFGALATKTYGDASFTLGATVTGGGSVTYSSSDVSVATVSGNTVTILKSGSTIITASSTGATSVPQTLTINKANLSVTADNKSRAYNTSNPALTITYSGFVNSETVANITAPSIGTSATISSNVGTYSIDLTGGSATNYNLTLNNGTLTINKADQTITFNSLVAKSVGDANFNLTATSTSNLTISYSSTNLSVATVSGSTVTIVGAGSTTIIASQAGNLNYNAALSVNQPLTVNAVAKTNQTITFGPLATKTYEDGIFSLTATTTSNLAISYSSSNTSVATISGSIVTIVGAGSATITASQAGDATFNPAAPVDQVLTVNKANQTITFDPLDAVTIGDAAFNLNTPSSANLTVTYTSSNTSVATVSGNTVTIVGVGSTIITASQAGNTNYNSASAAQSLTVNAIGKSNQTITFNTLVAKTYKDASFDLTATSTSGLTISYSSSNTSVATIAGSTVTIVGAGTTIITASQSGNSSFNAATSVNQTLTVNKANQTITFDALGDVNVNDSFELGATSTSNLTVTYTSSNTSIATISGTTVNPISAGTVTITASQAGNSNYNAATSVAQTLKVNPAAVVKNDQTITFNTLETKNVGDVFNLTATSTSGLLVTYTSSNTNVATIAGNTVTVVGEGTTIITASQAGNDTFNEATPVTQTLTVNSIITAVVDAERPTLSAYPNPTTDYINVQTASSKMKQIVIYTIEGRVMEQMTSSTEEVQFNVSSYNNGIYIVKISDEDNSATIKFVKK